MRTGLSALVVASSLLAVSCAAGGDPSTEPRVAADTRSADTTVPDTTAPELAERGSDGPASSDPADDGVTRVLFAGDSLMAEIQPTVAAALGDDVETRFLLSPSLIRDEADRRSWESTIEEFPADVVVVLVSHWERLTIGAQTVGDIADVDAYAGLVALPFIQYVAGTGAEVVWVAAPPLRDQRITAVYAVMNDAFRSATAAGDHARFVELAPALTDASGAYADALDDGTGTVERARNTDGIHFCPAGAIRVAEAILPALADTVGATASAGWTDGPWRSEPPFDKPAECPPL